MRCAALWVRTAPSGRWAKHGLLFFPLMQGLFWVVWQAVRRKKSSDVKSDINSG